MVEIRRDDYKEHVVLAGVKYTNLEDSLLFISGN